MKQGLSVENGKWVVGCPPAALTSTAGDGDYVSLKGYEKCAIVLSIDNATTVTGGTITLLQATAVAGTSAKELAFARMWANTDVGASDTLTETAVSSNTFTSTTTDNKNSLYVIEVNAADLDVDGGFDCLRVDSTGMANAVGAVLYYLYGARYKKATPPAAITD